MRKKVLLGAAFFAVALVAGCGGNEIDSNMAETVVNQAETQSSTLEGTQSARDTEETGMNETAAEEAAVNGTEAANPDTSNEDNKKIAITYMEYLRTQDFNKLKSEFKYDVNMKKGVEDGSLEASLKQLTGALGKLNEIEEPFEISSGGGVTISVPCKFENQNVNFNFTFNQNGEIGSILTAIYQHQATVPSDVKEVEMKLPIDNGRELPGTLTTPAKEGKYPIVILVHGSGANDRNESANGNAPFRDIAWGLAQQGIATYRYDKRIMVYMNESMENVDFTVNDETVNDAVSAVEMVKGLDNIESDKVYVLGHSLGGGMVPRIAQSDDAAGYIILAGFARKFDVIMKDQIDFLLSIPDQSEEQTKVLEEQKKVVEQLVADSESTDPSLVMMGSTHPTYWKDLLAYDPIKEAESIQEPVMVLQGEEDYQVTVEGDYQQWKDGFSDNPNWTFKTYPGLTHLFMKGERKNGPASYSATQNVDPQVISDIADFVMK